jgi:hypothetical protein
LIKMVYKGRGISQPAQTGIPHTQQQTEAATPATGTDTTQEN